MPGIMQTDSDASLLSVNSVKCVTNDGHTIFEGASFELHEGDIAVLRARSGVGFVCFLTWIVCMDLSNSYEYTESLHW